MSQRKAKSRETLAAEIPDHLGDDERATRRPLVEQIDPKMSCLAYEIDLVADDFFVLWRDRQPQPLGADELGVAFHANRARFRQIAQQAAHEAADLARSILVDWPVGLEAADRLDASLAKINREIDIVLAADIDAIVKVRTRWDEVEDWDADEPDLAQERKRAEYTDLQLELVRLQRRIAALAADRAEITGEQRFDYVLRTEFFGSMRGLYREVVAKEPPHGRTGLFVRLVWAAWVDAKMPAITAADGSPIAEPRLQIVRIGDQIYEWFRSLKSGGREPTPKVF